MHDVGLDGHSDVGSKLVHSLLHFVIPVADHQTLAGEESPQVRQDVVAKRNGGRRVDIDQSWLWVHVPDGGRSCRGVVGGSAPPPT